MKSLLMVSLIFVTGAATGWGTALHFSPVPTVTQDQCNELLKTSLGDTVRNGAAWAGEQLSRMATEKE